MGKKQRNQDFLESIFEAVKKKFEDASLEDLAFIASWLAGTYIAFNLAQPLKSLKVGSGGMREIELKGLTFDTGRKILVPAYEQLLEDPEILALSMVASYKFLKSDIGSISGVLGLLK